MSIDRIGELELRLARLERERRVSVGLAVLSLVVLVASQTAGPRAQGSSGPSTVKAPFTVVDDRGQPVFTVTNVGSVTKLDIVDNGASIAGMSASREASVLFLGGKNGGFARMAMDFAGEDTGPSIRLNNGGDDVLAVSSDAVSISAPTTMSPGKFTDKDAAAVMGSLSVRDGKGRRGTTIGDSGVRVHGADGVSIAASLGVDDAKKGRLVVGLPTGPRGVLAQPSGGGVSFALFDGPGKDYRVGMLAAGDVSFLRLNSGRQQAALIAETASSALNLFNASGSAAASLSSTTSGAGQLELGDPAGNTTVEAGTTTEGLGVVRAGPRMGGAVGFEGTLPWAILGKHSK